MVDTINPNTGQPDGAVNNKQPLQASTPESRFFGGFDQPNETKINLAESSAPTQPQMPTPQVVADTQPVADVAPLQPAEVKHTSYVNTANMINWRGILVIAAIGLLATVIVGMIIYFAVGASNQSKLEEQQVELDIIKAEIVTLSETPMPLELPPIEKPTSTSADEETMPVVEAPVVTPTPVVIPQEQNPVKTEENTQNLAG
jgi:hypothetical protein